MNLEKGTEIEILERGWLIKGTVDKLEGRDKDQKIYFQNVRIFEYCPNTETTVEDCFYSFEKRKPKDTYFLNLNKIKDKIKIIKPAPQKALKIN